MNKAIVILFFISIFFLSFLPVRDTDFGWHYRCGEEFLKTGILCTKNNFSYFLADYKAYNPSFIYDIVLALIYDRFGFIGVSILGAIIITLSALGFFLILKGLPILRMGIIYLTFFISTTVFNIGLRSQIITYLLFIVTLFILDKAKNNRSYLFLPLLFIIWINTHIGFFVGPIITFFYIVEQCILNPHKQNPNQTILLISVFIISLFSTLINPYGVNVYREVINHGLSPLNKMIAEWTGSSIWQSVLITLLTMLIVILNIKKKSFSLFEFFSIIFFGLLAIRANRNIPFFYTLFFYFLIKDLVEYPFISKVLQIFFKKIETISLSLFISFIIFLCLIQIPKTIQFSFSLEEYCNNGVYPYPCKALNNFSQLSGNVYAAYEWGGFLIWKKPKIKVFVDGRMPAWKDENGDSPYQVYLNIIQTKNGWNEKLNKLKTDYLLIANGTFLDLFLQKKSINYGWTEKYRDEKAVIYHNENIH